MSQPTVYSEAALFLDPPFYCIWTLTADGRRGKLITGPEPSATGLPSQELPELEPFVFATVADANQAAQGIFEECTGNKIEPQNVQTDPQTGFKTFTNPAAESGDEDFQLILKMWVDLEDGYGAKSLRRT
ncbi:Protein of unknown function [Pyronema omphalodes CBS 100304]|uniref:Uncharacterized protein n=1 Tax=Pyronema omphalodes (strain CBS 100304) TaxID=1076935 RepID=U4KYE9_PYROM|nr:Protein of unknown function [Pyronema omphalodes CBS 100304]